MIRFFFYFGFLVIAAQGVGSTTYAASEQKKVKFSKSFSMPRDFAAVESESKLTLKNTGASAVTVYGIYVRQFAYVTADQDCTSATVMYAGTNNVAAGAIVMPVSIGANSEAKIGSNYLYNLLYNALYFNAVINMAPAGCSLPGCTWGADTTLYKWCVYLGAMAPVTGGGGYTSKVSPSTTAISGGGYNYDLVTSYNYIGPITCDDQALTCSIATSQTQEF